MDYGEMKAQAERIIEKESGELFELNKQIFDFPELSLMEYETSKRIVNFLTAKGFETEYPFSGFETAFLAKKGSGGHGRKIALLTEYDALPDVGHACGHCLSCCISILAALSLIELQDELDCDVHIIGTPAEEYGGAKGHMADRGIFDGYDVAMMVHMNNWNIVSPRVQGLSACFYRFHGKAAHAAAVPWEGRNAFNAGQLFFHALDMLRQHIKPECRVHGIFTKAGASPGTVPDETEISVYFRSFDKETQVELARLLDDCAKGAATATQCGWERVTDEKDHAYDPLKKNETGDRILAEVFAELGLPLDAPDDSFGSTDAGNVSQICPTFHPCLECVPHEYSVHQREFASYMKTERAYEAMKKGAEIIALQAIKLFSDDELLAAVKRDFERG